MASLLIAIIYMAFISLGLPDSLLGSAWPVMYSQLGVPLSYMGIISMIIALGTIFSSLASDFLTRKLGTGLVTALSVFMTAAALFGFSAANSFIAALFFKTHELAPLLLGSRRFRQPLYNGILPDFGLGVAKRVFFGIRNTDNTHGNIVYKLSSLEKALGKKRGEQL